MRVDGKVKTYGYFYTLEEAYSFTLTDSEFLDDIIKPSKK